VAEFRRAVRFECLEPPAEFVGFVAPRTLRAVDAGLSWRVEDGFGSLDFEDREVFGCKGSDCVVK
jgi:hypothetical protein